MPVPQALQAEPQSREPAVHGLYLHLPFCKHKCHYCDFYSVVAPTPSEQPSSKPSQDHDLQLQFTDALLLEIDHVAERHPGFRPRTVFAGGGTPTLLRPALWRRILDRMNHHQWLDQTTEFTVEANPETVTPELAELLAGGGVNRVSLGAQSFDLGLLKVLERWHDPESVPRAVRRFRGAGIHNVSLDLIFAIPGQNLSRLDHDLDEVLSLQPDHLSVYGLTFEPNTPLTARLRTGQITPVDEETQRIMLEHLMDRLAQEGFEHYEISNWSRSERRCEHNLGYWQSRHWLGLGPGAASHVDGRRWKNRPNLALYIQQSPTPARDEEEHLSRADQVGEQLMLWLRLRDGVPMAWLDQHLPAEDPRWDRLREHEALGFYEKQGQSLRLTRRGLMVADTLLAELL